MPQVTQEQVLARARELADKYAEQIGGDKGGEKLRGLLTVEYGNAPALQSISNAQLGTLVSWRRRNPTVPRRAPNGNGGTPDAAGHAAEPPEVHVVEVVLDAAPQRRREALERALWLQEQGFIDDELCERIVMSIFRATESAPTSLARIHHGEGDRR